MRKPIGSLLHGALDYLTGTSLVAASRLPALNGSFAGRALLAAGANHLAYSLVTDYELGALRKLPYKVHLAIDAAGALGLVAAGALGYRTWELWSVGYLPFPDRSPGLALAAAGIAFFLYGAGLALTQPRRSPYA